MSSDKLFERGLWPDSRTWQKGNAGMPVHVTTHTSINCECRPAFDDLKRLCPTDRLGAIFQSRGFVRSGPRGRLPERRLNEVASPAASANGRFACEYLHASGNCPDLRITP